MTFVDGLLIGLFIGTNIGFVVLAMFSAGKVEDMQRELDRHGPFRH